MTPQPRTRLGEILAARGYVSEEQIVQLLARASLSGKRIGEVLLSEKLITGEVLRDALEEQRRARGKG